MNEEIDYLWKHFAFNAEQRLKAFNFFVIFSVFANGGIFAAAEKSSHGGVFILTGGFIIVLSLVFAIIDIRSQRLLNLAVPGLKINEMRFSEESRLFVRDAHHGVSLIRYTVAFRALFVTQSLFGLGAVAYGLIKWLCKLP